VHPRRYRVQPFHLQAAAVRLEQTGHQPQQGGLAGTIRPHQPGDETATDVGIQRMQGRATGKGMAQRRRRMAMASLTATISLFHRYRHALTQGGIRLGDDDAQAVNLGGAQISRFHILGVNSAVGETKPTRPA
jgi:hypothetical protein